LFAALTPEFQGRKIMNFRTFRTLIRSPHLLTSLLLFRDIGTVSRTYFLHAAFETGLLQALRSPSTLEQITRKIAPKRPELLEPLLDQGVAAGELFRWHGVYSLRGRRAKAIASASGDALAAMVQELVGYHGSVFTQLGARINGAPLGNYLSGAGPLVARSSRIFEPFIRSFAQEVSIAGSPRRLLEIGCGSGIYVRYAADANPCLTGVAIDMQEEVVAHAVANFSGWGIGSRFKVRIADIRNLSADQTGLFDLITLYNNIYYFPVAERVGLFRTIRSLLAEGGTLALVSSMSGSKTAYFDLVLRSTIGCAPLPKLDELKEQLRESGFGNIRSVELIPGLLFYGITAQN
jgi:SAM-dependent methyltransferase